jgi:CheY-like chemotaxis protein
MTLTEQQATFRVLIADDDDSVRFMLQAALERDGFEVVAVANVADALHHIVTENFDVLLSDLHMPCAGDGFIVVGAMRHTHPKALALLLSGYPEIDEALAAVRVQADEVLVKPLAPSTLRKTIRAKLEHPTSHRTSVPTETVATILEHDRDLTITYWMSLVEHNDELTCVPLSFEDRTGHLPNLIGDLIHRLRLPGVTESEISPAAREHGHLRRKQGYTAAMIVEESRILQVSIFNTLQDNLARVDFSRVLLDVMTVADEMDSQLKQAMLSYVEPTTPSRPAA